MRDATKRPIADPNPHVVNSFAWNPEGTLARWSSDEQNSYARVFGYDEEGRLTKIERDYGGGDLELAYEYGYNSDGARVWKRDVLARQEYWYICRIGCGGVPMRVYQRQIGSRSWASVEDYLPAGNALGYSWSWRYQHTGGELLMMRATGEPSGYYSTDSNGLAVQSELPMACVCLLASSPMVCAPLGYGGCGGFDDNDISYCEPGSPLVSVYALPLNQKGRGGKVPELPEKWQKCLEEAFNKYCDSAKTSIWQLRCIIWAESCDDPNAKNPRTGASGLNADTSLLVPDASSTSPKTGFSLHGYYKRLRSI